MKLEHFLILCIKISTKWIKDIKAKSEIIKLLEENTWGKLHDTGLVMIFFLDLTPKAK